ncbi:hypothetical protein J6590_058387 [Homalodisca vitripennis]|nr:hypothetical protein J6590_058387 [Homalodisca vitripennis]
MSGLAVMCCGVRWFPRLRDSVEFYSALGLVVVSIVVMLHALLGFSAVLWLVNLAFKDMLTVKLLGSWVVMTALAVVATMTQVKAGQKASTIVRKYFHLLALFVFLPGVVLKPCLLYVASGVMLAVFIGLEMVRVVKLPPVSAVLDSVFLVFSDEKDSSLALTPIYLLVGCSVPLWLHPEPSSSPQVLLPLLSGLLSVGVGDTAASVCGSLCGRHFWPDSRKTKEGSAACFLSQLFFVIALIHFGYAPRNNLLQPIAAIAVVTLVEATTDQIDNLALPLIMYCMLL